MNVAHQGGERKIQFVVTAVDEGAVGIQLGREHGAHGAVRHPDALGEASRNSAARVGVAVTGMFVYAKRLLRVKIMSASSGTDWMAPNHIARSGPVLSRVASSSVPAGAPARLRRPPARPEEYV